LSTLRPKAPPVVHRELVEWWKLGLEYFKVAVGWPLIVLAIVVVLRKPLAGLFKRDLEAEAAGVRLRVGRAEEAVEQALEDAAQLEPPTAADTEPTAQNQQLATQFSARKLPILNRDSGLRSHIAQPSKDS
jgi:hypothetical protein